MKYLLIFLSIFALLNCKVEVGGIIIIAQTSSEYNVGSKNGRFGLHTSTTDSDNFFDENDIETNTKFFLLLSNSPEKNYNTTCRLWKDVSNEIFILCEMIDQLTKNETFNVQV